MNDERFKRMTKARQVLEMLVGGNHTAAVIAEKTGLSIADVREAVRTLRKGRRIESVNVPTHYRATAAGEKALTKPPTPVRILDRKMRERHSREEQARTLVGLAISNRPALAQVWGAPHA